MKSSVDIPVIGLTEAALHVASLVGDRFGLIVYHQSQMPFLRGIVRRYGMEHHVVDFGGYGFRSAGFRRRTTMKSSRTSSMKPERLMKQGAEVIIPMGISQCPVHIKPDWLQDQLGVPVVEAIGAPIRMAGLLAGLGLKQSRARWPKSRH